MLKIVSSVLNRCHQGVAVDVDEHDCYPLIEYIVQREGDSSLYHLIEKNVYVAQFLYTDTLVCI